MLPIGEFRQPRSGPLMLLFANSLDGVRGWFSFRDPARHGRPGGDFPCGADTRIPGTHPISKKNHGDSRLRAVQKSARFGAHANFPSRHPGTRGDSRRRLSGGAQLRSLFGHFCPPSPKKLRWRTGVPARQGSSTRVLPKFPPATTNHVEADASGRRIVSEPPSAIRPQTGETPFKSTGNPA